MVTVNTRDFPNIGDAHVFLDCETTGLNWWRDEIFGIALRLIDQSYYWDVRDAPWVIPWLCGELPRVAILDNHNIKFDLHFMREAGVNIDAIRRIQCTMVDAALVDEHEWSYDLDHLSTKHIQRAKDRGIEVAGRELLGKRATARQIKANLHRLPPSVVATYATIDVELAQHLRLTYLEPEIQRQDLSRIVDLERRLTPVLVRMEERGVRVDVVAAQKAEITLTRTIDDLQYSLNRMAGRELNINSPKQMREFFCPRNVSDDVKHPQWMITVSGRDVRVGTAESGGPSLNAEAMRGIPGEASATILTLRKATRTRDTFIKGHILGHHVDGIVHTNFNQTKGDNELGTGTGRLSANAPALQQIHKRNQEIAALVRALFIPYERQKWICADWDQKEFRWFAHYAKDPKILRLYADDPATDFHQAVANLTGLPRSPVDGIKGNAKQINLGLVFGMGMGKLAQEMGLPYQEVVRGDKIFLMPGPEAEEIFEKYHDSIPGVKQLLEHASNIAKVRGYVTTAGGRHIRFPGGKFVHKAAGLIFQGTAADCMKHKLIEHDAEWAGTDVYPILSVHDEIDFSSPEDPAVLARIKEINEAFDGEICPIKCRVPIMCSVTIANNWWEASK